MKKFLLILCLSFFAVTSWADEQNSSVFDNPLSPLTMDHFTKISARLAEHSIAKGNFEQEKKINRLNRALVSSGNFLIVSGSGMVWDTLKPFPSVMTLGKDYIIQSKGSQRTVLSAQGNETFIRLAEVISAVFTGNTEKLTENFDIYFIGVNNNWEMGLIPKDKFIASITEKIVMKGDSVIKSILIFEQNGDSTGYILSNHSYPSELSINERAYFTIP
ncbi:MAG: outer membrane lipoprotein carrier protein LolA [Treponema sp.]|jgi:hypothetical protein|nr:outer membrane lipoprotein carrier protein LolA [Treponema sp.]